MWIQLVKSALVYMVCMAVCYSGAKVYFLCALGIHANVRVKIGRSILLYGLLILFMVLITPIGIFGPAWIFARAELSVRSSESTLVQIIVGVVGWATMVIAALLSKTGHRFTEAMRRPP